MAILPIHSVLEKLPMMSSSCSRPPRNHYNSIGSNGKWLGAPVQPAMEFARQTVYLKRLGEMYNDIKDLKKKINN